MKINARRLYIRSTGRPTPHDKIGLGIAIFLMLPVIIVRAHSDARESVSMHTPDAESANPKDRPNDNRREIQVATPVGSSEVNKEGLLRVRRIWDLSLPYAVQGVAWSSDNKLIACVHGFGIGFDIRDTSGSVKRTYAMSTASVDPSIGLTPKYIVTGVSDSDGPDAMLKFWPVSEGSPVVLTGPRSGEGRFPNRAFAFSVSADGGLVAAYINPRMETELVLVTTADFTKRYFHVTGIIGPREFLSAITLSSDGRLLAVGTASGKVFVEETANPGKAQVLQDFSSLPRAALVTALAFSKDDKRIASAETSYNSKDESLPISISSVGGLPTKSHYKVSGGLIKQISWSADGEALAIIDGDQNASVISLKTGSPYLLPPSHKALAVSFSKKGSDLIVSSFDGLSLFQVAEK